MTKPAQTLTAAALLTLLAGAATAADRPLKPIYLDKGDVTFTTADGRTETARHIIEVRPLCAFKDQMTQDKLAEIADRIDRGELARRAPTQVIIGQDLRGTPTPTGGGLNLNFRLFGTVPQGADTTLQQVADLYASTFNDNITVNLDINFNPGFFGSTSASFFNTSYDNIRDRIVATADEDDVVPQLLRNSTLPVRDVDGGGVRFENSSRINSALSKALGGLPTSTIDASLDIGSGTNIDYTVTGPGTVSASRFSGLDILVHEVGHALGFLSSVGGSGGFRPLPLDYFRFESDQRPTDAASFTSTPRFFDASASQVIRHNFDDLTTTGLLENDFNFQSSHWFNLGSNPIGIMDPQLINGLTLAPELLTTEDIAAFDAMGWEYVEPVVDLPCNGADLAEPFNELDISDIVAFLTFFGAQAPFVDFAPPAGEFDISDVVAFLSLFGQGCP